MERKGETQSKKQGAGEEGRGVKEGRDGESGE